MKRARLGLALCLCAASTAAQAPEDLPELEQGVPPELEPHVPSELELRFEELTAQGSALPSAERGAALVALGPEALPLLVEALALRPHDDALRLAARGFGRAALASWWQGELTAPPRADARTTLALLAEVGTGSELELALALASTDGELAVEALGGILEREPALLGSLVSTVLRQEGPAAACAVRAAGLVRSDAALECLGSLLTFGPRELELCVLSAMEVCGPHSCSSEETRSEVRERLWADDAQVLRKAIAVSAALQDDESLERLVALLEHQDRPVAATALQALRSLSGRSFPDDVATWQRWLERESAWFEARAPLAYSALQLGQREHAIAAARELAQRRLHRRAVWQELDALLEHYDAPVRRAACEALGRLGLRDAIPALTAALADEDPSVVESAAGALARLGVEAQPPAPTVAAAGALEER